MARGRCAALPPLVYTRRGLNRAMGTRGRRDVMPNTESRARPHRRGDSFYVDRHHADEPATARTRSRPGYAGDAHAARALGETSFGENTAQRCSDDLACVSRAVLPIVGSYHHAST